MSPYRLGLAFLILSGFSVTASAALAQDPSPRPTSLDEYVATPDSSYRWSLTSTTTRDGLTTYVVDLTSQTWRSKDEVDRTLWRHWLVVTRPRHVSNDTAFLLIGGGRNGQPPPTAVPNEIRQLALATDSVVAQLGMVPNQPLVFHGDGQPRVEDDLIGYSFDQFFKTGDGTWPALLPMVKSAVRAMDTIQALMAGADGGTIPIKNFVVSGGSKRGWTTWLTSAVDDRVVASIPIVIDMLNTAVSMRHHHAAYGFFAPAVGDYERHGILPRMNRPEEYAALARIVDPFQYRDRLTMPKLLLNSAGDQFFLPDSSQFYFDELVGERHLRYVPNSDHSLEGTDALATIIAFYQRILNGSRRPTFQWSFPDAGTIQVQTRGSSKPDRVLLWQATNPEARDFRKMTIGPAYTSQPLEDGGDGCYLARVDPPQTGWTAFFVELTFDAQNSAPLKLTTPVRVVPDVLPFEDE